MLLAVGLRPTCYRWSYEVLSRPAAGGRADARVGAPIDSASSGRSRGSIRLESRAGAPAKVRRRQGLLGGLRPCVSWGRVEPEADRARPAAREEAGQDALGVHR